MRGKLQIIGGIALLAASAAFAAPAKKPVKPAPSAKAEPAESAVQNCDAHQFETVVQLAGADGQVRQSKVRVCGTEGQTDADWIRTLEDAEKKTAASVRMSPAAKDQIVTALKAEIARLSAPAPAMTQGTPVAPPPLVTPAPEPPIERDYASLPPLPTAPTVEPPHLLGPAVAGAAGSVRLAAPPARLTLRCAIVGDEDRPQDCDRIERNTVLVLRAEEPYPKGLRISFVRRGDDRGSLTLPPLQQGQTASLRLPAAVCSGVVRSKLQIQAVGSNVPAGTPAGTVGEYDLDC